MRVAFILPALLVSAVILTGCGDDAKTPSGPAAPATPAAVPSIVPSLETVSERTPAPSPSAVPAQQSQAPVSVQPTQKSKATQRAQPVAPVQTQPAQPEGVSYANCAAVRAAGKAPLHRGDPGYSKKLDRDGDGIACE